MEKDAIEEIMFWIPDRDPLGVAVSILSYKGQLRIGLSIDEALLLNEKEVLMNPGGSLLSSTLNLFMRIKFFY